MAGGGLAGLAFVGSGYDQAAVDYWRRKQLEDAAAGRAALGRSLSQLTPSPMPEATPMPQQPQLPVQPTALQGLTPGQDQPPQANPAPFGYGVRPGGNMPLPFPLGPNQGGPPPGMVNPLRVNGQPQNLTGPIIPPGGNNALQSFNPGAGQPPAPAPGPPPPVAQPRPGGGAPSMPQQGPMTWQDIAHAVIRANPNAPPEVIMEAVSQAMPLMQADSRVWWQTLQAELQRERMTNQSNIAQSRIDEDWAKANLSAATRKELTEKGILSRETIAGEQIQSREGIAARAQEGLGQRQERGIEAQGQRQERGIQAAEGRQERGIEAQQRRDEYLETGREARSVRSVEGAEARQERAIQSREGVAAAGREAQAERQKVGIEAQRQRQETAEMSKNVRFGLTLEARKQQFDQQLTEKKKEFDEKLTASKAKLDKNEISDEDVHNVALAIANNKQAPYTGVAARSGAGLRVMSEVYKMKPDYDATKWRARNDAVTRFSSGKQGDTIRALKVADSHLETLTNLARALSNGDVKSLNAAKNFIADQLGYPAPASFDAARQIVAAEVIKAVSAAGGGVKERLEAAAHIDRNSSLQSILGAVTTYRMLLGGQIDGFRSEYEAATGNKDFDTLFNFKPSFSNKFPGGARSENTNDWQVREVASDVTPDPIRPGQQYAMVDQPPGEGGPGDKPPERLPTRLPASSPLARPSNVDARNFTRTPVEVPPELTAGRGNEEYLGRGTNPTPETVPQRPVEPISKEQRQLDKSLVRGQKAGAAMNEAHRGYLEGMQREIGNVERRNEDYMTSLSLETPQLMKFFKGHPREEEFLSQRLALEKRHLINYGEGPAKKEMQTTVRALRKRLQEIGVEQNPMSENVYRQP